MRTTASRTLRFLIALFAPAMAPGDLQAQATVPYPPPGYAEHFQAEAPEDLPLGPPLEVEEESDRRGAQAGDLYLSLLVGPNHTRLNRRTAAAGQASHLSATGALLSVAGGAAVHHRLVVFGELALGTALDPETRETAGGPAGGASASGTRDRALTFIAAGAGVTTRVSPAAVELQGSLLLTQARLVDRHSGVLLTRTRFGPALHLGLGRTWSMTEDLGIGLQLRAHGCRLAAIDNGDAWWGLGLLAGLAVTLR